MSGGGRLSIFLGTLFGRLSIFPGTLFDRLSIFPGALFGRLSIFPGTLFGRNRQLLDGTDATDAVGLSVFDAVQSILFDHGS
ncbi:MAG: hypothetical protein ISN28_15615 [Ectothiorhodospiraceae bacterium AqS1]|nr:hypothetical protein [Ectothiorhodospiraceae bacterium AqS1]MBF2761660.1 hypothetical protein [Ectothiorhodospiraceae bacterium AqS1]